MRATCPECGAIGHVAAFFADDDGKRLIGAILDLPAELHRAVLGYLGLFKPPKNALSTQRATRLVGELKHLVVAGSVCRDERGDTRRTATASMWAEGIEQMLTGRGTLTLPLANHNYLRAVVFTIADTTEARAEQKVEQTRQAGRHRTDNPAKRELTQREKYDNHVDWLKSQLTYDAMTKDEFDQAVTDARKRYGIASNEKAHE